MNLSDLMVDTKSAWFEFPGYPDFEVELAALSRAELVSLRKKCTKTTFDKNTRQPVETLDEERFVKEFTRQTVKNWKGFQLTYLQDFVLIDLADKDPESELPYSPESAETLVKSSSTFDTWINEMVFDLTRFR